MSSKPVARTTNLVDSIRANVPMFALLREQKQPAEVENAIRQLAEDQIGFVRVRNPLIAPLSLDRLVLQITGDDADEQSLDNIDRVRRSLIARSTMQRQIVVVVEQAETLTPEALDFLHGLPGLNDPSVAPVQVALVGSSALGARLADSPTYIIRDPAVAAPASVPPAPKIVSQEARLSTSRKQRPRSASLLVASLVLTAAGAILFMVHGAFQADTIPLGPTLTPTLTPAPSPTIASEPPQTVTAAMPVLPEPQSVPPPVQPVAEPSSALEPTVPQVSPIEPPIPEPPVPPLQQAATDRARLYREFTAFLDTSPMGRRLSQAEREALLQDYLARHQTTLSSSQAAEQPIASTRVQAFRIPGEPRVLLFFIAGSDPDLTAAKQEAELLRDRVAGLELQPVSAVPRLPTIRYEFPADRTAALALAETTPAPGGAWQVEDITASPKRPQPGTIEMWLPRR
ncbi:MAG: hypothetical protein EON55_04740 [Alphaproteobacteria bacterium]|nr:MAG: hypothetical protein EON55_04740 [Alphaproteobacteria bacterium]